MLILSSVIKKNALMIISCDLEQCNRVKEGDLDTPWPCFTDPWGVSASQTERFSSEYPPRTAAWTERARLRYNTGSI